MGWSALVDEDIDAAQLRDRLAHDPIHLLLGGEIPQDATRRHTVVGADLLRNRRQGGAFAELCRAVLAAAVDSDAGALCG